MKNSFYKKVDRSLLTWGTVIPKDLIFSFEGGEKIKPGKPRQVKIVWGGKKYFGEIRHVIIKGNNNYYHLRWNKNNGLLVRLRKTFIQTYIITESQKEFHDLNQTERKFRSNLQGGQQEVLIITPLGKKEIALKPFIVIENKWNFLFRRLAQENVFGWFFDRNNKYLIYKSIGWKRVREFHKYKNASNVIYYLVHTRKKLLYVGKARHLKTRVVPGLRHQGMPGDWDKFRYDIVKPEYSNILDKIEDHTIRAFASILNNNARYSSLGISDYKLINRSLRHL